MNGTVQILYDNETYTGNLVFNGDEGLSIDGDMETLVNISLFTWRRDDTRSPRFGWAGDSFTTPEGSRIGSRLYTLRRRKVTQETLILTKSILKEALNWMIEDNIAASISIEVERFALQVVAAKIEIIKPDNSSWAGIWEIQLNAL